MIMKTKKRFYIFALLLVVVPICFFLLAGNSSINIADNDELRIDYVGSKSHKVKIDNVYREKGYCFRAKAKIELADKEYLKVTLLKTQSLLYICGKGLRLTKTNSISGYVGKRSAHGKGSPYDEFKGSLESYPWQMISDTILITSPFVLDRNHYFIFTHISDNKRLTPVPYYPHTNELVLSKEYFQRNQMEIKEGKEYCFRVDYYIQGKCEKTITENFKFEYLPIIK